MPILITTGASLFAGFVAAFIVHFLTRSREREVWVRDRRLAEWRELLEVIASSAVDALSLYSEPRGLGLQFTGDQKKGLAELLAKIEIVLRTRIFIAEDIRLLGLPSKVTELFHCLDRDRDKYAFSRQLADVRTVIVAAALDKGESVKMGRLTR